MYYSILTMHAEPYVLFPFPPCMQNQSFSYPNLHAELIVLSVSPILPCMQTHFYSFQSFPTCRNTCTFSYPTCRNTCTLSNPPCMQNRFLFSFQSFPSCRTNCTLYYSFFVMASSYPYPMQNHFYPSSLPFFTLLSIPIF